MRVLLLVAGLLLALPVAAGAEDFLIDNGLAPPAPSNVIDDARYLDGRVYVRNVGCGTPEFNSPCPAPGAATEVELADGGDLDRLSAWDSSSITLSGGVVLVASGNDTSKVTIDGGDHLVDGRDSSTVTINGGNPQVTSFASSTVTINDSDPNTAVNAFESSNVVINGGGWITVGAEDSSTVTVNGGLVDSLGAGTLGGDIVVKITGGTVLSLWVYDSSTATVSGGEVGTLWLTSRCTVTVVGGSVGEADLGSGDTIEVVGRGFAVDGSPVPYGNLVAESGTLTARLASGDFLDMLFDRGTTPNAGTIRLVEARPIPALSRWGYAALVAFLAAFGVAYRLRRR